MVYNHKEFTVQSNVCALACHATTQTIDMFSCAETQIDHVVIPLQCVATKYQPLKKRSAQIDKIQTKIHDIQTDPIDIKHDGSQYNSTNCASTATLTDGPIGLHICIPTDPPVKRHIQTLVVKTPTKKFGTSTKCKLSQSEWFHHVCAHQTICDTGDEGQL